VIGVYRRADLPRSAREVCLALWRLADPGNVFGASIALSAGCADPTGPKAVRASAGAIFRVPLVDWEDAPRRRVALVAHGGAPLAELDLSPPLTFLLGSEREGVPAELVTEAATIPLPGAAESLNVAAAGAIALYELSRR
jgi:RNA methyltransferase, TrmH family